MREETAARSTKVIKRRALGKQAPRRKPRHATCECDGRWAQEHGSSGDVASNRCSLASSRKTSTKHPEFAAQNEGRQTLASATRQPGRKLKWAKPSTIVAVLFLVVSLLWEDVQPSQLSRSNGEPKFRILSATISTWDPQAEVCGC